MEAKIEFEELYEAYMLCFKNKKRKNGTYNFVNNELCENLLNILEQLNNRTYTPEPSNCYVITDPALREIYAAQFKDRIVQHLYLKELEDILENNLVDGCSSCRLGKGTDYALKLLKKDLIEVSDYGKKDCYFLKIDLSGYFMSIDRKQISEKFSQLILNEYRGRHKELLLYLTPIIFENNPAQNCRYKCNEKIREMVPDRRKMDPNSDYGMAIGNLTAQAASNLNLNDFDNYVIKVLKFDRYIRYVDDIVIIASDREKLINSISKIENKLKESHQILNYKKTIVDTAYHGVKFLGKISYPYGYQKASKQVRTRVINKAQNVKFDSDEILLAKVNSQIGVLKNYNCRKLILNYAEKLPIEAQKIVVFNNEKNKFEKA